ncbi:hypothetical protein OESDEN_02690 [Oesophagostomum dentatum]|uniref:Uncharacterized protein n=1 Tax=Oesophagostomum dentatum TaxID=61180 RepID=A0A0B1TIF2_OESDE|nr:hypothetical protein OESDEN_02690 [Oesophagostomum dentatum]
MAEELLISLGKCHPTWSNKLFLTMFSTWKLEAATGKKSSSMVQNRPLFSII